MKSNRLTQLTLFVVTPYTRVRVRASRKVSTSYVGCVRPAPNKD